MTSGRLDDVRIAVLSDTHAPRFWKACPPSVARHLDGVDAILHAGDVCVPSVLDELSGFAPVHVVRGNNDGAGIAAWGAPERLDLELGGVRIGMVHISGPATGRGPRLRRMFPDAGLVVFGHSHIPWNESYAGQRQLNPGSPTDKRRQTVGTMALVELDDGAIRDVRIVETPR